MSFRVCRGEAPVVVEFKGKTQGDVLRQVGDLIDKHELVLTAMNTYFEEGEIETTPHYVVAVFSDFDDELAEL